MKWYKRDPDAALTGFRGLTHDEKSAYGTILDLLYSRDGDLPDDDRLLCVHIECRPQWWRRVKMSLIARGKIWSVASETGPKLMANRVETTLKEAQNFSETQSKRATSGWVSRGKSKENKAKEKPPGNANTTTTTTREESSSKLHLEDLSSSRASAQESDLNNSKGREAKQTPYYADFGAPELDAWDAYGRATTGKTYPRDKRGGWQFPSQWPPNGSAP